MRAERPQFCLHVLSPLRAKDKTLEVNMNTANEKIFYRVKGNRFLFIARSIWNIFWFSIGTILSIGTGSLFISGIAGFIWNNGKLHTGTLNFGLFLIPLLIIVKILYTILLRKAQFYIISNRGVTSEGGVLNRFNQTLRLNEIQSVSYTQTLIQQILGCGNIVISTAATYRGGIVLKDVDQVKIIYNTINNNR